MLPISRLLTRGALALVVFVLAACGSRHTFHGTVYDPALPAPAIEGMNWDGTRFSMRALDGKVVLLFFGYTSCPDICPLALAGMKQVKQQLGSSAASVAFVFVSVDPERDTPERLAAYVPAFDAGFYGVHVPAASLAQVKNGYGVYAETRVLDAGESAAGYLIDHTGWTYLIDKRGHLRAVFDTEVPAEEIVEDVEYLLSGS